jgi:lysozyme family protein
MQQLKPHTRAAITIPRILRHEGGWADHPRDPGGATNLGVTIGTLKRLGIDIDGDGDSDIADLRLLSVADATRVYKLEYWDKVCADLLPDGIDYAVADFAVNSGPSRAARMLQRCVGAKEDGVIGNKTLAAVHAANQAQLVNQLCNARLAFLRSLKHWPTFGKGWGRRVESVRRDALRDIATSPERVWEPKPAPRTSIWAAFITTLTRFFS